MIKQTLLAAALAVAPASVASAAFMTITPDGDFSDWATVPVLATDAAEGVGIDLVELRVANDATNLYVLLTFGSPVNPQSEGGTYLAIDSDDDISTGFDAAGTGIGSNLGFANDFPFTQTASAFNSGGTTATGYAAAPYNAVTTQQEIAIPLSSTQIDGSAGGYSGNVFPLAGQSIALAAYSLNGSFGVNDSVGAASYEIAAIPEPASLSAVAAMGLLALRRRK